MLQFTERELWFLWIHSALSYGFAPSCIFSAPLRMVERYSTAQSCPSAGSRFRLTFWSVLLAWNQFTSQRGMKIKGSFTSYTCFWALLLLPAFMATLASCSSPTAFWKASRNSGGASEAPALHVHPCKQAAVPSESCMPCPGHQDIFHRPREAVTFIIHRTCFWYNQTAKKVAA